jgi:hypothetical protein
MEWAHDGKYVWVLQMHKVDRDSSAPAGVIHPGEAATWQEFHASDGLDKLREIVNTIRGDDVGIVVTGGVGVSSHVGDILRRAGVPSRLASDRL